MSKYRDVPDEELGKVTGAGGIAPESDDCPGVCPTVRPKQNKPGHGPGAEVPDAEAPGRDPGDFARD